MEVRHTVSDFLACIGLAIVVGIGLGINLTFWLIEVLHPEIIILGG